MAEPTDQEKQMQFMLDELINRNPPEFFKKSLLDTWMQSTDDQRVRVAYNTRTYLKRVPGLTEFLVQLEAAKHPARKFGEPPPSMLDPKIWTPPPNPSER